MEKFKNKQISTQEAKNVIGGSDPNCENCATFAHNFCENLGLSEPGLSICASDVFDDCQGQCVEN